MCSRGRLLVALAVDVDNTSDGINQAIQKEDTVKETPDGLRQSRLTAEIGPAVETQIEGFEHLVFYSQPGETAANTSCSRTSIPSSSMSSSSSSSSSTCDGSSPEDNDDTSLYTIMMDQYNTPQKGIFLPLEVLKNMVNPSTLMNYAMRISTI